MSIEDEDNAIADLIAKDEAARAATDALEAAKISSAAILPANKMRMRKPGDDRCVVVVDGKTQIVRVTYTGIGR